MAQNLQNFQTFRQNQVSLSKREYLIRKIQELQTQLTKSNQNQAILKKANDKLTQIIVRNNRKDQHDNNFLQLLVKNTREFPNIQRKSNVGKQNVESYKCRMTKQRKQNQQKKYHNRIRTQQSDQNNFILINTNSNFFNKKETREKIRRL